MPKLLGKSARTEDQRATADRHALVRAYGEFTCTHDCSDISSASFLSEVGKTTPLLVRISTVGPEAGSADTVRDVHGFSMKIYTDEGNLDWVFNNTVRTCLSSSPD
jgi:catalase